MCGPLGRAMSETRDPGVSSPSWMEISAGEGGCSGQIGDYVTVFFCYPWLQAPVREEF